MSINTFAFAPITDFSEISALIDADFLIPEICPQIKEDEPGRMEYQYLNGSTLYLGEASITFTWANAPVSVVTLIKQAYRDNLVNGSKFGVYVPNKLTGDYYPTSGFMLESTGTAGGDGSTGFEVTFYRLHEHLKDLTEEPGCHFDLMAQGLAVNLGSSNYYNNGWRF